MIADLPASDARALIRALAKGTTTRPGAQALNVGQDRWLQAQVELLEEIEEDGHAEARFVRGAYGAGKSHFLCLMRDLARARGWLTCHIECRQEGVQIDRFETLYARLMTQLEIPGLAEDLDPVLHLLTEWATALRAHARIRSGVVARPFEDDRRIWTTLDDRLGRSALDEDFIRALIIFARADTARDRDTARRVVEWLKGGVRMTLPGVYLSAPGVAFPPAVHLTAIGPGKVRAMTRGLLWLIRDAGFKGLVWCIDEIEELARLNTKRQTLALQALREFVDHCGGDGDFRSLCLYLAATPDMFVNAAYFPRYDALATRIQPVSDRPAWRGPVVDLDQTAVDAAGLARIAANIQRVFALAYGEAFLKVDLAPFVHAVGESAYRIARPRLLVRVIVDALHTARDDAAQASPAEAVSNAALALTEERAA